MPEVFILLKAKDEASAVIKGIAKESDGLKGSLMKAGLFGATAVIGIGATIGKLAYDAAMVEPVRITFDNLTESIGATADEMLDALKPATMGVLTEIELMKAANKLMAMGLADSVEEAAQLAEMAVTLGIAMGEQAGPALENFTLMLANQSIPRMDTYGLSSGQARLRIEELMAATEGLTREEAFKIAVLEQGADAMDRVGDITGTAAVKMGAFQTKVQDAKDDLGNALIPVLEILLEDAIGPLIDALADDFIPLLAEQLPGAIEETISGLKEIGAAAKEAWKAIERLIGWLQRLEEFAGPRMAEEERLALPGRTALGKAWAGVTTGYYYAPDIVREEMLPTPGGYGEHMGAPITINVHGLPGLEEAIEEAVIRVGGRSVRGLTP